MIIAEAHQEARSITRVALTERERLFAEARRVETLLRVGARDGRGVRRAAVAPDAGQRPPSRPETAENWPRREDTREFAAVAPVADRGRRAPRTPAAGSRRRSPEPELT